MDELIKQLARERAIQAEWKTKSAELRAEMDEKYKARMDGITERLSVANASVQDTERRVRGVAIHHFGVTGDKHAHEATTIRLKKVLAYDPEQAKAYCLEHLPEALALKKSAFEKVAIVTDPDFVTITQQARATIARDLSEWAAEG